MKLNIFSFLFFILNLLLLGGKTGLCSNILLLIFNFFFIINENFLLGVVTISALLIFSLTINLI